MKKLILLGAGGHAKVVIELFRAANQFKIVGCLDRKQSGAVCGVPILGDDSMLPALRKEGVTHAFVSLGDNAIRARLATAVGAAGFELANAVAASAVISSSAKVGAGIAIMPGVVVNAESVVGDLVILNTKATVDHECSVERAAHIAPGAILLGGVSVGELVLVGAGSCVLPGISIGNGAVIGAGSVVTRNIEAGTTCYGVPARPHHR